MTGAAINDARTVAGSLPQPLLDRIGRVLGDLLAVAGDLSYWIDRAQELDSAVWDSTVDATTDPDPRLQDAIKDATGIGAVMAIIEGLAAKIIRVNRGIPAEWREADMNELLAKVPSRYRTRTRNDP